MREIYEVKESQIIGANSLGILLLGIEAIDGEAHILRTDASGNLKVDLAASSGTVTADTELTTEDVDLGAGTDTQAIIVPAFAASGGHTTVSASNPFPVDTELPAAAALADTQANPTVPIVGAYGLRRDANATTYSRASGELALANDDGTHATDDTPVHVSLAPKRYVVDANLDGTYDSSTVFPVTSDEIDARRFTKGAFYFDLDSTGAPQDISFILQTDPDGTGTWFDECVWWWSNVIYDDTICATVLYRRIPFELNGAHKVRVAVQGNIASGQFDITESWFTLQAA